MSASLSPAKNRPWLILIILSLLLLLAVCLSLAQGAVHLSWSRLWLALWQQGDSIDRTILWDLRLPRIIAGVVVGAALGIAGALLQGLLRNSLADPFVLGISAGSGLVTIAAITLNLANIWLPFASWIGGIATAALVYLFSYQRSGILIERLLLAGVAVSSLFFSLQTILLLLAEDSRLQSALNWLVGSLNGRGWTEVNLVTPYIMIGIFFACFLGKSLNLLNLGDDLAVSLGISLSRTRLVIGLLASLLAASAVSISGLIGFVGLIVPHGIRLIVGNDYRWLLPLSSLGGALVLSLADLIARLGAVELPVGAVTAIMGSPVFIWLLYRRDRLG
jgi:iron complex transport system permease protein